MIAFVTRLIAVPGLLVWCNASGDVSLSLQPQPETPTYRFTRTATRRA